MKKPLKISEFLKRNKRKIKGLYLLNVLGLYSCGGGSDDNAGGVSDLVEEPEDTKGFTEVGVGSGKFLGTDEGNFFAGSLMEERTQVDGGAGDDVIRTGSGDDVVRGGAGVDKIDTGEGDDVILLVGEINADEYKDASVEPILSDFLLEDLAELNERILSDAMLGEDVEEKEIIEGGEGTDTLIVYGEVDLSLVKVEGIERVLIHSELRLSVEQASQFKVLKGDGSSVLIIGKGGEGEGEVVIDVKSLGDLSGIKELRLEEGVKLQVSSVAEIESLKGVGYVSGEGSFFVSSEDILDGGNIDELVSFSSSILARVSVGSSEVDVEEVGFFVNVVENSGITEVLVSAEEIDLADYNVIASNGGLEGVEVNALTRKLIIPNLDFEYGSGYKVKLSNADGDVKIISVIVTDENELPVAKGDGSFTVNEEEEKRILWSELLENDVDEDLIDVGYLRIMEVSSLSGNEVRIDRGEKSIIFRGGENYFGTDTVSYVVEDTVGNRGTADFAVSVLNLEDEGVISLDGVVNGDGEVVIGISLEDVDGFKAGGTVVFELVLDGDGGSFTAADVAVVDYMARGSISYDAGGDFVGFKVLASYTDGGARVYGGDGEGSLPKLEFVVGSIPVFADVGSSFAVDEELMEVGEILVEGNNGDLSYELGGVDGDLFNVEEDTGMLRFNEASDFENPFRGGDNVYDIMLTANDGVFSISQAIRIEVGDVEASDGVIEISGDVEEGGVFTASLNDEDGVDGQTVVFELLDGSGNALELLDVNDGTALVDVDGNAVVSLDAVGLGNEAVGRFRLSDMQAIVGEEIRVKAIYTDDNGNVYNGEADNEPIVFSERYEVENVNDVPLIETEGFTVDEGFVGSVGTILAGDEEGDKLIYSLLDERFAVDEDTGDLSLRSELDYEEEQFVELLVTVSDGELSSSTRIRIDVVDVDDDEVIGGIGFNRSFISSWHDVSVSESLLSASAVDGVSLAGDGEKVFKWLDLSGNGNDLMQADADNQGIYEGGILRYNADGTSNYNYENKVSADALGGLSSFSVLKIRDVDGGNYLFGDDVSDAYSGEGVGVGNEDLIFSADAGILDVKVNGVSRNKTNAEWEEGSRQIVYARSARDGDVSISRLSQDRDESDRSLRGDISEVIVFSGELSSAEVLLVNNYLGAKWDVELGEDDYYGGDTMLNGDYDFEVSGLVKLSDSEMLRSFEFGGLKLLSSELGGAIADVGDGFFMGHNGGDGLLRVWYGDFTDASGGTSGGTVDLSFSVSELGLVEGSSYQLVVGDEATIGVEALGEFVVFEGVDAVDGVYRLVEDGGNVMPLILNRRFEVDEEGRSVGMLEVLDTNKGGLSYSVGGIDGALFVVNGEELEFVSAANYEMAGDADGDNVYEVVITANDGENLANSVSSVAVSVTVNDVNDAPIIATDVISFSVDENEEVAGWTITATDEDGDVLSYSLGGANAGLFVIEKIGNNGLLSVRTGGIDYEELSGSSGRAVLSLMITAEDAEGGVDVESFSITVNDVNDAPIIATDVSSFSVDENKEVAGWTITASDEDGDVLSYSLGGANAGLFVIEKIENNGLLKVQTGGINYEELSGSSGRAVLSLMITAVDGDGATDVESFSITVNDVNDAPIIATDVSSFSVDENKEVAGWTITASDEDGDVLDYSLGGVNAGLFVIEKTGNNGLLKVQTGGINYEELSGSSGRAVLSLMITARDPEGDTDVESFSITVNDVNDAPIIATDVSSFSVDENKEVSGWTITASDEDGDGLSYSLGGANAGLFVIEKIGNNGLLKVQTGGINYEELSGSSGTAVLSLMITAVDGDGATDVESFSITVNDVNDAPVISAVASNFVVDENEEVAGWTITATDEDGDVLSYSLGGANAGLFVIEKIGNNGLLKVQAGGIDYEELSGSSGTAVLSLMITAEDADGDVDVESFNITVNDVSEVPLIATDITSFVLNENEEVAGWTITASDEDGDVLSYSLGGANAGLFVIEKTGNNGLLKVQTGGINYEGLSGSNGTAVLSLMITAEDADGNTDVGNFIITVNDVNDAPMISAVASNFVVDENEEVAGWTITANDEDGDVLSYSLGGVNAGLFVIEKTGNNGLLKVQTGGINYEGLSGSNGTAVVSLMITAEDADGDVDVESFSITVNDVNEAPMIATDVSSFSVDENEEVAGWTITASDEDGDVLDYSLGGANAGLFMIEKTGNNGLLKVQTGGINYEGLSGSNGTAVLSLMITAEDTDGDGDVGNFIITVNDVNEAPVISAVTSSFVLNENEEVAGWTITADDEDGDVLDYSLGGVNAGLFVIEKTGNNGLLKVQTGGINYEELSGSNGTAVLSLMITAEDIDGDVDVESINITVNDVNDAPMIATEVSSFRVDENEEVAGWTITASDEDGDVLSYSLGGVNAGLFVIEKTGNNGLLKVQTGGINYEGLSGNNGTAVLSLMITAEDTDGDVAVEDFIITVDDVNESPVINSSEGLQLVFDEHADGLVVRFMASDPDGDVIIYSVDNNDFTIDNSGELRVKLGALDYESLSGTGAGGTAIVEVKVTLSDGRGSEDISEIFMVTVRDANDPPEIDSSTTPQLVFEENTGGAIVSLEASDPEGDDVSYSVENSNFEISDEGLLSLKAEGLDYESLVGTGAGGTAVLELAVTVRDSQAGITESFIITISDINEAPVIASSTIPELVFEENTGGAIVSLEVRDPEGDDLSYSVDNSVFTIDSNGLLILEADGLNYESMSGTGVGGTATVEVNVTVSDNVASTNDLIEAFTITIVDVNESPVVDTSTIVELVFEENMGGAIASLEASDSEGDDVSYSVGDSRFEISSQGELSLKSEGLDYESFGAAGVDGTAIMEVVVTISDNVASTNDLLESFFLTIVDVNESPVIDTRTIVQMSFDENAGGAIVSLEARDPEGDVLSYSVDNSVFTIDSNGLLSLSGIGLDYESFGAAGVDGTAIVEVIVTVSDNVGSTADVLESFMITVNDVNESPVLYSSTVARLSFGENEDGTVVSLDVRDPEGDTIVYSVDNNNFVVSSQGELSLKLGGLDYESLSGNGVGGTAIVEVNVTVGDGHPSAGKVYVIEDFMVTISDVNEEPEILSSTVLQLSFDENVGGEIVSLEVRDPEGADVSYSVGNSEFSINEQGVLSLNAGGLNYDSLSGRGHGTAIVEVVVTISDGSAVSGDRLESFMITVNDVNESPEITGAVIDFVVNENEEMSWTIEATDENEESLIYRLNDEVAGLFSIERAGGDGLLRVKSGGINYEELSGGMNGTIVIEVMVTAIDSGGKSDSESFNITVRDVNEEPEITVIERDILIDENEEMSWTIEARDEDEGNVLAYSLLGSDADLFVIEDMGDDGILKVRSGGINYEELSGGVNGTAVLAVIVTVIDREGGGDSEYLNITVRDVNDAPEITTVLRDFSVEENRESEWMIEVNDEDGDSLVYSLGGVDGDMFVIDNMGNNGVLKVKSGGINYEELDGRADGAAVLAVIVTVSDGSIDGVDSESFNVTVRDVNEEPEITMVVGDFLIEENEEVGWTIEVSDEDDGSTLVYSLSGANADLFSIVTDVDNNGVLSVGSGGLNYEELNGMDGSVVLSLTVTVSDGGGGVDSQDYNITVRDVNDAPAIRTDFMVEEGATLISGIVAEDDDGDTLIFSIDESVRDGGLFSIDENTGELRFNFIPDYENARDGDMNNVYEVLLTANDGMDVSSEVVNVSVSDITTGRELVEILGKVEQGATITASLNDEDGISSGESVRFELFTIDSSDTKTLVSSEVVSMSAAGNTASQVFTLSSGQEIVGKEIVVEVSYTDSGGTVYSGGSVIASESRVVEEFNIAPVIVGDIMVVEGETLVSDQIATDANGHTLSFGMDETMKDGGLFSLDENTGRLIFKSSPDYEMAMDVGSNNVYEVLLSVSDGRDTVESTVNVTVTDLATSGGMVEISGDIEEGGTIRASLNDEDGISTGETVVFSLFSIDADDMEVALSSQDVVQGPAGNVIFTDFILPSSQEIVGKEIFLRVSYTDADDNSYLGGSGNEPVVVSGRYVVSNVNDEPIFDTTTTSFSVDENEAVDWVVSVDDEDEGAVLSYDLGGAYADLFTIMTNSDGNGVLSVVGDGFNYESFADRSNGIATITVMVTVMDELGAVNSQDYIVIVNDVNESPVLSTDVTSFAVDENESSIEWTIRADDEDDGAVLSYSLGGANAGLFNIVTIGNVNGLLGLRSSFNYEELSGGNNGTAVVSLMITVNDGLGGVDSHSYGIVVSDINDAPEISTEVTSFEVDENEERGWTIMAMDDDGDLLSYSLGGANAGLFDVSKVGDNAFLEVKEGGINYEELSGGTDGTAIISLILSADDGAGRVSSEEFYITVNDVNDAPRFTTSTTDFSTDENVDASWTIMAMDEDGDLLNYSLGNTEGANLFSINKRDNNTAILSVRDAGGLNYEALPGRDNGTAVISLALAVDDVEGARIFQGYNVTVMDVSESPEIMTTALSATNENVQREWIITVIDDDNAILSYDLRGADAGLFSIRRGEGNNAILSVRDADGINYETLSGRADGTAVVSVEVVVRDDLGVEDTQMYDIRVNDINDAPRFTLSQREFVVEEEGTDLVAILTAEDEDEGDRLFFGLSESPKSGPDAYSNVIFIMYGHAGELRFRRIPSYESPLDADQDGIYNIQVGVSDSRGAFDLADISVTVADVDEVFERSLAGLRFPFEILSAWHDASIRDSFIKFGNTVSRWLDQSGNRNHLVASLNQYGTYEDGVFKFNTNGRTNYTYSKRIFVSRDHHNPSLELESDEGSNPLVFYRESEGISAFSVVKIRDVDGGWNNFLGDIDQHSQEFLSPQGRGGGSNLIFGHNSKVEKVQVDGVSRSKYNAEWVENETQIVYAHAGYDYDPSLRVGQLSQHKSHVGTSLRGDISEVIVFADKISDAEVIVINNYLSSKWDVALGARDYYVGDRAGDRVFYNELSGLIKLSNSEVLSTYKFGGIEIENSEVGGAIADNGDAFFMGHNGGSGLSRMWYGDFTDGGGGVGGTIDLRFFVSDVGLVAGRSYKLLAGNQMSDAVAAGSEYLSFTGVNAVDGVYRLFAGNVGNVAPFISRVKFSVDENILEVGMIEVSDSDSLSYAISGTDVSLFSFSTSTGELRFNSATDYDNPDDNDGDNVYDLVVTVDDGRSESNSVSSAAISVIVKNVNYPPVISSITMPNLVVDENSDLIITTIQASDPEGSVIVYSVNRGDNFEISDGGVLSLKSGGLNYEEFVSDGTSVVEVVVKISDIDEDPSSITQVFSVTINDINEEPSLTTDFSFGEGTRTIVVLKDEDSAFSYVLSGEDARAFSSSVVNGELRFVVRSDYEDPRDANGDNVYEFSVSVDFADSQADEQLDVQVTIEDRNDDVVIAGVGFNRNAISSWHDVKELGNVVLSGGDNVIYWPDQSGNRNDLRPGSSGEFNGDSIRLDLDGNNYYNYDDDVDASSSSGLVTFSVLKIRNIPSSGPSNFLFGDFSSTAYHGGGGDGRIFGGGAMLEEVQVDGEEKTVNTGDNDARWELDQRQIIYTRSERSSDVGIGSISNDRLNFRTGRGIRGDLSEIIVFKREISEAQVVLVNNYLGAKWGVELADNDYYEGDTGANGDYDNKLIGVIKLSGSKVLQTREEFSGLKMSSSRVGGAIVDEGDAFFMGDNGEAGLSRVWYGDFTDGVGGGRVGGTIDLSFLVSSLSLTEGTSYQLVVGNQAMTGVVAGSKYLSFTGVEAIDGVYRLIEDGSNVQPLIRKVEFSLDENSRDVGTVGAFDTDSGLIYSIGGTDSSLFAINANTGVLRFNNAPNYEMAGDDDGDNVYELTVTVNDNKGLSNSVSSSAVKVIVNNVLPVVDSLTISSLVIDENEDANILTIEASDPEGTDVSYSVDRSDFVIDGNGVLSVQSGGLNYEDFDGANGTAIFEVIVTISNSESDPASRTEEFLITVNDVNESPEIYETEFSIAENETETKTLLFDVDSLFTHSQSGIDSGIFSSSVVDNKLLLELSARNYEYPEDSDRDNIYEFTIGVDFADGQFDRNLDVVVTITDVDDADTIAGIAFDIGDLNSWHDASVAESLVDVDNNPLSDGGKVRRWWDQSKVGNTLWQSNANNQAVYEDGVVRYSLDGSTSYNYSDDAVASRSSGLTTFSVIKVRNIPSSGDTNFLFGSNDGYRYHGGSNGNIFRSSALMAEVQVNGEEKTESGGTDNARWDLDETQIIYTRSERDPLVKINRLSKDRGNNGRSIRGDISEVIVFNRELSEAQEVVLHNYLSSKWDVGLAEDDYYNGDTAENSEFDYEVSGLIKLSSSEILRTEEFGGLRIFNRGAISDEGDAFFVGHNGVDGLSRVWYGDFTDAFGGQEGGRVDLLFSVEELGLTAGSSYQLSVNRSLTTGVVAGENYVAFQGVEAVDGLYRLVEAGENVVPFILGRSEYVVDENIEDAVGEVRIFDVSSNSPGLMILGTDASLFTHSFSNDGLLFSFVSSPNYENPLDDDEDNVYEIYISVYDGTVIETKSITIKVEDVEDSAEIISLDITLKEGVGEFQLLADSPANFIGISETHQLDFTISNSGLVEIVNNYFDYENPMDSDNDNVYEFLVTISDAADGNLFSSTVTVTIEDVVNASKKYMRSSATVIGNSLKNIEDGFVFDEQSTLQNYTIESFNTGLDKIDLSAISDGTPLPMFSNTGISSFDGVSSNAYVYLNSTDSETSIFINTDADFDIDSTILLDGVLPSDFGAGDIIW